jgi:hypothetical protein
VTSIPIYYTDSDDNNNDDRDHDEKDASARTATQGMQRTLRQAQRPQRPKDDRAMQHGSEIPRSTLTFNDARGGTTAQRQRRRGQR